MKKLKLVLSIIILSIAFISCSALESRETQKNADKLKAGITQIIIPEKTTEFEVRKLLGNPTVKAVRKGGTIRLAYYSGDFYHQNSEENKRVLDKYIPAELLNDQEKLKKVVLAIFIKHDEIKDENIIYRVEVEIMRM